MNDAVGAADYASQQFDSLLPPLALTRRGFVETSLGAGFAAAVLPVAAQTTITTDTQGLTAGEVKIPTRDGAMVAYRAMPAGATRLATILVVQEIFGVHEHIKDVCRRFAKLGFLAIAPELFARQGDAGKVADVQTLLREIVSKVPDAQVMDDLDATAAWAAANGGDAARLGVTGFCWGGRIVWLYAATTRASGPASPGTAASSAKPPRTSRGTRSTSPAKSGSRCLLSTAAPTPASRMRRSSACWPR